MGHTYVDDIPFNRADCAKVGGLTSRELAQLELETFLQLDFDLFVTEETYVNMKKNLVLFARHAEALGSRKYLLAMSPAEQA